MSEVENPDSLLLPSISRLTAYRQAWETLYQGIADATLNNTIRLIEIIYLNKEIRRDLGWLALLNLGIIGCVPLLVLALALTLLCFRFAANLSSPASISFCW